MESVSTEDFPEDVVTVGTLLQKNLALNDTQLQCLLAILWKMTHGETFIKRSENVWEWTECPNL